MDVAHPAPAMDPPGAVLRQWLRAAQDGEAATYRRLLTWAADRARARGAAEPEVRRVLVVIDRLRPTYEPRRCPLRWIDAILAATGLPGT